MAKTLLAYPNRIDADPRYAEVKFEGGLWQPELPLENLRAPELVRVARSVDLARSSTRFWVDLGQPRDIRFIGMPWLECGRGCRVQAHAYDTPDETAMPIRSTGWIDVYPVIYPAGSLPAWHPSFVDGRLTAEETDLFPMPWYALWEEASVARYLLVEIDDVAGDLGYVEIPRLFVSPGWQPSLNFVYGVGVGWEANTNVETSYGGAEYFEVLEGSRVARFEFRHLPQDEALTHDFDMQRSLGIHRQLFFIYDPADTVHRHRRSFLARHRLLSPVEASSFGRSSIVHELKEVIA
jgi:hypothetical protein